MNQIVWSGTYRVSSFLVNLRGRIGLSAVLNLIQDVGWMHAFELKIQLPKNHAWVFTRQTLRMDFWPVWNDTIRIETWVRPPQDRFLLRDYLLFSGDRKIGECTSAFTIIDMETRKAAAAQWDQVPDVWRRENTLAHVPAKLVMSPSVQEVAQFQVRNSDLDMNHHVNNTKYAQWILDTLPLEILKGGVDLCSYEVNFIAEARSGDIISLGRAEQSSSSQETRTQFRGTRVSDGQIVFVANLDTRSAESN